MCPLASPQRAAQHLGGECHPDPLLQRQRVAGSLPGLGGPSPRPSPSGLGIGGGPLVWGGGWGEREARRGAGAPGTPRHCTTADSSFPGPGHRGPPSLLGTQRRGALLGLGRAWGSPDPPLWPAPPGAPRAARPGPGDPGAEVSRGGARPGLGARPAGAPGAPGGKVGQLLRGAQGHALTRPRGLLPAARGPEGRTVGASGYASFGDPETSGTPPPVGDAQSPTGQVEGAPDAPPGGPSLGNNPRTGVPDFPASTSARPRPQESPGRRGSERGGAGGGPGAPGSPAQTRAPGPRACAAGPAPPPSPPPLRVPGLGRPGPHTPRAPARPPAPGAGSAACRSAGERAREAAPGPALAAASAPAARRPRRGAAASPAHARRRLPRPCQPRPRGTRRPSASGPGPQRRRLARWPARKPRPEAPSATSTPPPTSGPAHGPPAAAPGGTHPSDGGARLAPSRRGRGRSQLLPLVPLVAARVGKLSPGGGGTAKVTGRARPRREGTWRAAA